MPDAIAALRERILKSGSHKRADRDLELLARSELRPVRLLLEYLKPELAFEDIGVRSTIVVFGSTRLLEPRLAEERLAEAEAISDPLVRQPAVQRARSELERSRYCEIGRELGQLIGRCGEGRATIG